MILLFWRGGKNSKKGDLGALGARTLFSSRPYVQKGIKIMISTFTLESSVPAEG